MLNLNPDNDHKTWSNPNDWTDPRCWIDGDPWDFPFNDFWDGIDLETDPEEIVRLQKVWVLEQVSRANSDASDKQPRAEQSKVGNGADHGDNCSIDGAAAEPNAEYGAEPNTTEQGPAAYPDTLDALKEHPLWVFWRNVDVAGRKTKLPYNSRNESLAKSDDPSTWNDWAWTARVAKKYNNQIGVVFGTVGELHLAGVDLDSCRNPRSGELEPWAKEVIERLGSYAEVSPSKTGVKVFFWYRVADNPKLDKLFGGPNDGKNNHGKMFKKGGGEHPQAIEVHRSNRYFTVTGLRYENFEKLRIVSVEDIRWLVEQAGPALRGASANAKASSSSGSRTGNKSNDNSRSAKAFREARRLKTHGKNYEEVRDALLNHADPDISEWARTKGMGADKKERELRRAYDNNVLPAGCRYEHFRAYMVDHTYIYLPTMTAWPAASVNSRLPWVPIVDEHGQPVLDGKGKPKKEKPNIFLDKEQPVEQIIWTPDEPMLVEDRYLKDGSGWVEHEGGRCLNFYMPPTIKHGDPRKAGPWLKLVRKLYHGGAKRIVKYMASKVQNPGKKINHALFLGGAPGIGKDSLLQPLVHAVGPWNFTEVKPSDLFEQFNPHIKTVILRISEAHDTGDVSRYQFYERIKTYAATPPDVMQCNDKYIRKCNVINCMGVIVTSNHLRDGIYLPADDRRHDVHWSECKKEDFEPGYFDRLWSWYENEEGFEHVAAYLATLDISDFNPKAPPPKTPAFWAIVDANRSSEESELADVIDLLGNPKALTLANLYEKTTLNASLAEWLKDRKNRPKIPHQLERCGYEPFRNPDVTNGDWKIGHARHVIYVRQELTVRERMEAAKELIKKGRPKRSWSKGKPQRSWSRTTPNRPNFAGGAASGKPDDAPLKV
ncbi:MAG: DUF5906 domain-containing protein [Methylocystis sp.]